MYTRCKFKQCISDCAKIDCGYQTMCICHIYLVQSCVKTGILVYNLQIQTRTRMPALLMLVFYALLISSDNTLCIVCDQTLCLCMVKWDFVFPYSVPMQYASFLPARHNFFNDIMKFSVADGRSMRRKLQASLTIPIGILLQLLAKTAQ